MSQGSNGLSQPASSSSYFFTQPSAPELGEHPRQILVNLGYTEDEIENLLGQGTVFQK